MRKKEVKKGWKIIGGKNKLEGNVIPEGPWKHLQKDNVHVQINELGRGRMSCLNVMNDIMNCGPGPWLFDWQASVSSQ